MLLMLKAATTWLLTAAKWVLGGGRWKIVLIALTAILIALLYHNWRSARAERDEARVALDASRGEVALLRKAKVADDAAVTHNRVARTRIAAKEVTGRAKTEAALARHPDWADQPIPADIIDSLRPDPAS
jgi:hypothetical protein